MTAKILYEIRNLVHRYDGGPVTLDIDSLQISEGSVTGLVGPNGSGKSTLLKILAFLEPPAGGKIIFDGKLSDGRETELRRQATYLLQDSYLLRRSVYDNIAYGLKLRGQGKGMDAKITDSLRRVGLAPEEFANRPWHRLSGGEVQRAALAARLALRPRVLLLDEPTANVDEASAQLVKDAALSAWKERGTTVITATHDLVWLHEVSSSIISLYHGRVIGSGAENFIYGSWQADGDGVILSLPDGQTVIGHNNTGRHITGAVLSPSKIKISTMEPPRAGGENVLKGTVTQMTLERGTGDVIVSAETGGMILKARTALEVAKNEEIFPASQIYLSFSANDIRWLDKG